MKRPRWPWMLDAASTTADACVAKRCRKVPTESWLFYEGGPVRVCDEHRVRGYNDCDREYAVDPETPSREEADANMNEVGGL